MHFYKHIGSQNGGSGPLEVQLWPCFYGFWTTAVLTLNVCEGSTVEPRFLQRFLSDKVVHRLKESQTEGTSCSSQW